MQTIRRFYLYAVALVSLESVLWGMIGLARQIVGKAYVGEEVSFLARAMALTLVGMPIFGLHWWLAQRYARQDMEERASLIRALFLYGVLLITLIPSFQNFLALSTRLLLQVFNLPVTMSWVGGYQTFSDNFIAISMNLLATVYFWRTLRADWKAITSPQSFAAVRRLYRYVWLCYGLGMTIAGTQQLLTFLLLGRLDSLAYQAMLGKGINALPLTILGATVWTYIWVNIQQLQVEEAERESLLRLSILYVLSLVGMGVTLISSALILTVTLEALLGEAMTITAFLNQIGTPVSLAIPFGIVWAYHSRVLLRTPRETPQVAQRAGLRRLYFYVLAAAGLAASFVGLHLVFRFAIHMIWIQFGSNFPAIRKELAQSLATLITGLPLWLFTWRPMQAEALSPGESGDHARRSVVRKAYVYLVLFASVIGGMVTFIAVFYRLFLAILGTPSADLARSLLELLELASLFILLGLYHGLVLRQDGRLAAAALAHKHAAFPVLIFDPEDGFGQALLEALRRQAPHLPVEIYPLKEIAPQSSPQAVVLPAEIALDPPARLRTWLGRFEGMRIIVPRVPETGAGGKPWIWSGGVAASSQAAQQAAAVIRQLAEGQTIRFRHAVSPWLIVGYVIGGLLILQGLLTLMGIILTSLLD